VVRVLQKGGYDPAYERVETADVMGGALGREAWDVIIADYKMPHFSGLEALKLYKEKGLDIPFIIVSGAIGEETAVGCMISGAHDYVMKNNLSRLVPAIQRELQEARSRRERKKAEEALWESEARYRSLFENNHAIMLLIDPDNGAIADANAAASAYYGWSLETLKKMRIDEINTLTSKRVSAEMKLANSEKRNHFFFKHRRADGTICDVEVYSGPILLEGKNLLYSIVHDITERKHAEKNLFLEKQRLTMITDHSPYGLVFIAADGTFEYINPKFTEVFGYGLDDVPDGKEWFKKAYPDPQYRQEVISAWLGDLEKIKPGEKRPRVFTVTCKDGARKVVNFIPVQLETGQNIMACQDVTQLKDAEERLTNAAAQWRTTFDSIADPVMILDNDFKIVRANRAAAVLMDLPVEKVPGNHCYALMHHSDGPPGICPHAKMLETKEHAEAEVYFDDSGKWFSITVDPMFDDAGNLIGAVHAMKDMTERRAMEEQIRKSEENYRSIFENSIEGIFQTTPEGRFLSANPALAKMFGYESPEDLMNNVTDLAKQGYADPEERVRYKHIIEEHGSVKGFETLHYKKDGGTFWVSINAHSVYDGRGKLHHYEGTLEDVTPRKHAEEDLNESMERLKNAMEGIIDTISAAVEVRDPYTSGHQRRVSSVAVAIASQMGLPEAQIEGIRTAAVIHDLGKISIPAEILSKPRKLSEVEFSLIKTHPQIGYDILKDIKFPWPVARIILQHHERLNGSGYPQGLRDGQILLEAKILAVADVVEAIASHRPYRAALGIEAALQEIEENRGVLYDADTVNECLKLFRENGFNIE